MKISPQGLPPLAPPPPPPQPKTLDSSANTSRAYTLKWVKLPTTLLIQLRSKQLFWLSKKFESVFFVLHYRFLFAIKPWVLYRYKP